MAKRKRKMRPVPVELQDIVVEVETPEEERTQQVEAEEPLFVRETRLALDALNSKLEHTRVEVFENSNRQQMDNAAHHSKIDTLEGRVDHVVRQLAEFMEGTRNIREGLREVKKVTDELDDAWTDTFGRLEQMERDMEEQKERQERIEDELMAEKRIRRTADEDIHARVDELAEDYDVLAYWVNDERRRRGDSGRPIQKHKKREK